MSEAAQSRNIVVRFDMRCSPHSRESQGERYRTALAMARWADNNKVDVLGLSEHHVSADGFLSSPLSLAGMIASNTKRIRISVSALLVPLHDPLRLAEDIAVLDLVSQGRFSATCGLGYREVEYQALGADWQRRGQVFDEKLTVMLQALSGEHFEYRGVSMQLNPAPQSPIQSLLLVGGNSAAAARRAARFQLLFCPAIDDIALDEVYRQACHEQGFTWGFTIFPREPATTFISEDPQRNWQHIGEYLLYDATAYGSWQHPNRRAYAESFARDAQSLIAEGKYRILTPEQAVEVIEKTGSLHLAPLTGGVPSDMGWKSLQLFEERVQPYI
ncbi:MAG: LLM class flavin-dependent oxidoreductase [Gammaproteobacteria bacterium]|jgi:alkanesulfonate monooxygenase SsuD/methylene tetrahydromethanopterin reductase-like flavin-dependent oxidoreductase (luciferase family)|nr:LLM class flavin-dependent oxidoreductase [Gammaproteobacteria bacterium]